MRYRHALLSSLPLASAQLIPLAINTLADVQSAAKAVVSAETFTDFYNSIQSIQGPPTTLEDTYDRIAFATNFSQHNVLAYIGALKRSGVLGPQIEAIVDNLNKCKPECNGQNNNQRKPASKIYPKTSPKDAPYSHTENVLRSAIYIPPGFTYGKKRPVILHPGTGVNAGQSFKSNIGKFLKGSTYADPVYLNTPNQLLDDAQSNAEFAAYAVNYISGISKNAKVGVVTWSQGSIDMQWALQYWPSTRNNVADVINASGDYDGTILAQAVCAVPSCVPSVWQQEYNSHFIRTLHTGGGKSSWVPTTSVYSITDTVVQPQIGAGASAYIQNTRHAGAFNAELQSICLGKAAGLVYPHEGPLYNPLMAALVKDSLTHDGPGNPSRLDLDKVCSTPFTPGLTVQDVLDTEDAIVIAVYHIFLGNPRVGSEPAIRPYARADS